MVHQFGLNFRQEKDIFSEFDKGIEYKRESRDSEHHEQSTHGNRRKAQQFRPHRGHDITISLTSNLRTLDVDPNLLALVDDH